MSDHHVCTCDQCNDEALPRCMYELALDEAVSALKDSRAERDQLREEVKLWTDDQMIRRIRAERDQLREDNRVLLDQVEREKDAKAEALASCRALTDEALRLREALHNRKVECEIKAQRNHKLREENEKLREALDALIEFAAEQDHALYVERGEGMGAKYRENDAITKARAARSEDSTP